MPHLDRSLKTDVPDWVVKKEDFQFFIECVLDGLWKNHRYLAELCSVNHETIAAWKKTPQAIEARKKAALDIRRTIKGKGTVERKMTEAGLEVEPTQIDITSGGKPLLGGLSVNAVHSDNSDPETAQAQETH